MPQTRLECLWHMRMFHRMFSRRDRLAENMPQTRLECLWHMRMFHRMFSRRDRLAENMPQTRLECLWHMRMYHRMFSRRDRLGYSNVSDNRMCHTIRCLWHMNVSDMTHSRATEWELGIRRMKCLSHIYVSHTSMSLTHLCLSHIHVSHISIVSHIPSANVSVCDIFYRLTHSIVCSIASVSQTDTLHLQMCQSATYAIVSVCKCVSLWRQTRTLTRLEHILVCILPRMCQSIASDSHTLCEHSH